MSRKFKFGYKFLITFLLFLSSLVAAYEIPELADFSHWEINELNPKTLREGYFYYGIKVNGKLYFSTMREKEAEVGKRAGGHFKLLRGHIVQEALDRGSTIEEARAEGQEAFKKQAAKNEKHHTAQGFGFKAVRGPNGELILKWHGFNSYK